MALYSCWAFSTRPPPGGHVALRRSVRRVMARRSRLALVAAVAHKDSLGTPILRLNQLRAEPEFRRLVRSLWLRPSQLLAPCADPTTAVQCPPGRQGLVRPGFQASGHPEDCRI